MLYTVNWLGCYLTLAMFTIKYTICGEVLLSQLYSVLLFAAFCLMPIWSRTCKIESSMQILTLLFAGLKLHPFFAAFYSPETYEWLCARSANYFFLVLYYSPGSWDLWIMKHRLQRSNNMFTGTNHLLIFSIFLMFRFGYYKAI